MVQGAENDLKDIRFYTNTSQVEFLTDNEPIVDLNDNTLTVDNKAILANSLADVAETTFTAHQGSGGISEHGAATTTTSGFMVPADKIKLNQIGAEAQINILAPVDALTLVSGEVITLHDHIAVTTTVNGFMLLADKGKLDGIASGANVNVPDLATADALARDPGGDADSLHTHVQPTFDETFLEGPGTDGIPAGVTYHSNVNHTGLPNVPAAFSGFAKKTPYNLGPSQVGPGTTIFTETHSTFTKLHVVTAGFAILKDLVGWGLQEEFRVADVAKSGLNGIVTYQVVFIGFGGDNSMRCWQGGYGE